MCEARGLTLGGRKPQNGSYGMCAAMCQPAPADITGQLQHHGWGLGLGTLIHTAALTHGLGACGQIWVCFFSFTKASPGKGSVRYGGLSQLCPPYPLAPYPTPRSLVLLFSPRPLSPLICGGYLGCWGTKGTC